MITVTCSVTLSLFQAKTCNCPKNYGPPRCENCMEPFIHPEQGCKNKCDKPTRAETTDWKYQCHHGGKCVDQNYQPTNETGQYCLCSIHYGGQGFILKS